MSARDGCRFGLFVAACACALALAGRANAAVTTVVPFTGLFNDTFNQYSTNMAVRTLPVLGGAGAVRIHGTSNSVKIEFSSQLGGDLVSPRSGMMMGQLGVMDWIFNVPAVRFGGWWENNSGADHATVTFFDAADNLLATFVADVPAAAQRWTWNGWESDTPFTRVRVVGNGLINGFIWYEDVQLDVIPEPAFAWSIVAMFGLSNGRFRRLRR